MPESSLKETSFSSRCFTCFLSNCFVPIILCRFCGKISYFSLPLLLTVIAQKMLYGHIRVGCTHISFYLHLLPFHFSFKCLISRILTQITGFLILQLYFSSLSPWFPPLFSSSPNKFSFSHSQFVVQAFRLVASFSSDFLH